MHTPPSHVSVIIRNYNRAHCITRALDSACAQTYTNLDIVVVDDASTDDSLSVLDGYASESTPLSIIKLTDNVGAGQAANIGVEAADGIYLAFLDSDDAWHPRFVEYMVDALESAPRAALAFCDYVEIWEPYAQERLMRADLPSDQREGMLAGGFIHSMSLTMMRAAAFAFVPPFEPRYSVSHDFMMWLNLALELHKPFVHVARPLARHYRSADGVTTQHDKWLIEYRDALDRGFEHQAAAEYAPLREPALHNVAIGIVARRQLGQWLEQTCGALVSVVILAPPGPLAELQRAVACVDAQTYRNFEIIVVDNAGEEARERWLAEGDLERWAHVRLDELHGSGAMVNLGATAATGELLAFLNTSDSWDPRYLEAQVRAHSYVLGAPLMSVTDARVVTASATHDMHHDLVPIDSELATHMIQHPVVSMSLLACRRDRFLQTGGLRDALVYGEAMDLILRLLALREPDSGVEIVKRAPPVNIARALVTLRQDPDAQSDAARADRAFNYREVLGRFIREGEPSLKLLQDDLTAKLLEAVEQCYP